MHYSHLIITGAGGGIGKSITRSLAPFCDRLTLMYMNSHSECEQLKNELSCLCDISLCQCDFNNPALTEFTFGKLSNDSSVDGLVNNAGVSSVKLLQDCSLDEILRVININLTASVIAVRSVIPGMIANHCGNIVNISSVWGQIGASCEAVYSASKSGLVGFSQAMARELGPSGIRVNAVCPGMTDTPMNAHYSAADRKEIISEIPLGRIADPNEIAGSVKFLLSEKSSYINGQCISPNGGLFI